MPVLDLTESLKNGLRPEEVMPQGAQVLSACTGLRPTSRGLVPVTDVQEWPTAAQQTAASMSDSWPFPQLFRLREMTLVLSAGSLWRFDEGTGLLSLQTIYGADPQNSPAYSGWDDATPKVDQIHGTGGAWHAADFGDTVLLFNGANMLFKTGHSNYWWNKIDQMANYITKGMPNTGCAFKEGRAVYGGFDHGFWSSEWQTFWANYDGNLPDAVANYLDMSSGAGPNWIWWSTIGGGDLLWLVSKSLMMYGNRDYVGSTPTIAGGYDETNPYIFELLARNEAGLRPMPWQGSVRRVLPLGQHLMVYGDEGIAAMTAHASPVSTLGLTMSQETGMAFCLGGSAVGGGDAGHVFVDYSGELWFVDPNLSTRRLGYREFFSPMLGTKIVVSYDPLAKEFWISNGTYTYVLTETGLGRSPFHPSNIQQTPDQTGLADGGAVSVIIGAPATTGQIVTEAFSGPEPGVHCLDNIRLTGSGAAGTTVSVYWQDTQGGSWNAPAESFTTDGRGVAWPKKSGVAFRVILEPTPSESIDGLFVTLSPGYSRSLRNILDA